MQSNEMTIGGITLPTVIVAALMGSAITLLGVFLQNLFENYRNNKKLKHEARQTNQEREMALRRDVFLEASSEMAKATYYIAKFGDLNLPSPEHEAIAKNFGAAMSKLHMVAGMDILTKAVEASDVFASISLKLNQLRLPLLLDLKNLEFLQKNIENYITQQRNLVTRIDQLQTEDPQHHDIPALSTTFQELESRIRQTREKYSDLRKKTIAGSLNLSSEAFKGTLTFAGKIIEAHVALRRELGFDLKAEEENYKRIIRQSHEKATKEMEQYINRVPKVFEEKKSI